MKKFLKILGNIIFCLIIFTLIAIIFTTFKAKKEGEIPSFAGYRVFNVLTGSMSPTIPEGSLILIKETPKEEIKKDDVITFKYEGTNTVVTHRVVDIINNGNEFITRGDANNVNDPRSIKANEVQGVVIKYVASAGDFLELISKNIIVVILAIISLLIITGVVIKILSSDKKQIK